MGKLPSCITPECLAKVQKLNDDHAVKAAVDANMHVGGTTIDAVQAAVAKVHEFVEKGAGDRKKAAEIQKWRAAMREYEGEITKLPTELANAEKHYLSLAGWTWPGLPDQKFIGDAAYTNKKYYDYLQAAQKQKDAAVVEGDASVQHLDVLIDSYRAALVYASKMHDLADVRAREHADLRKSLDAARTDAMTNDRRVFYENAERRNLAWWRTATYVVMYVSFAAYFFLGDLGITTKTLQTEGFYRSRSFWTGAVLSLLYLSTPLWLNRAVIAMFRAWEWIRYVRQNEAPRDAYAHL